MQIVPFGMIAFIGYCNQIWYKDVPLQDALSGFQISRQLDSAFTFYGSFHTLMKETQPIFEDSYLRNALCDLVKI